MPAKTNSPIKIGSALFGLLALFHSSIVPITRATSFFRDSGTG
jgi:hypothetical protein